MMSKKLDYRQIEWWIVTGAALIAFLFVLFQYRPGFFNDSEFAIFEFASRLFILGVLYASFHLIHLVLIPRYEVTGKKWKIILWIALTGIIAFVICAIFGFQARLSQTPFPTFFLGIVVLYACYLIASNLLQQALTPPRLRDFQLYNAFRLILSYLFTVFFLFQLHPISGNGPVLIFGVFIPLVAIAGFYNYFLIYRKKKQGKVQESRWYTWGLVLILFVIFGIIAVKENQEEILLIGGLGLNAFIQLIFFPLTTLMFRKYDSFLGKIYTLSNQVNQGNASFDFLRSQINPHFLFNALNTLYASALIEKAEKTSDGIQKLGDMMRFMLHENQLPTIPLSREIEYLKNYLDLQMLRFGTQPNLDLSIQINENQCHGEVAPMLLIPFVENAFKHGISAKEKSWIRLNLRCLSGSVHLDLVNSVHQERSTGEKTAEDSGIGLENVKKRLELLYPDRHQLTMVSNDSDFFVHLSVQIQSQ